MADEKKKPEASTEAKAPPEKEAQAKGKGLLIWLIMAIVVLAGSLGGLALSMVMGGSAAEDPNAVHEKPVAAQKPPKAEGPETAKPWMFDKLDTVVANLDEPGVTRYVRISVILEMSSDLDSVEGALFLEEKKILLQDWMTTYLAGLSLEDVRGSRNLNRIKQDMLNHFNTILFGSDKAQVQKVLFKEFAIQ